MDIEDQAKELLGQLSPEKRHAIFQELADPLPWFQIVEGDELEQGDILDAFPVFSPPADFAEKVLVSPNEEIGQTVQFTRNWMDVIVMSQSCDLVKGRSKITEVLLCPVFKKSRMTGHLSTDKGMEDARRGNLPNFHLLNSCSLTDFEREFRLVSFQQNYSSPVVFVRRKALKDGKRLRLCPPYREHLSQAFARYFMRVGLPVDIPPFE